MIAHIHGQAPDQIAQGLPSRLRVASRFAGARHARRPVEFKYSAAPVKEPYPLKENVTVLPVHHLEDLDN